MKTYQERMKETREDHDERQADIASVLGVSRQQYNRWETGSYPLPVEKLMEFCQYYNVSADYILFGGEFKNLK